jgi:hypothetical protein
MDMAGFVCASDGFGPSEAAVACRQMAMSGGTVERSVLKKDEIVVQHLTCAGTERNLSACTYEVTSSCKGDRAAVVSCTGAPLLDSLGRGQLGWQSGGTVVPACLPASLPLLPGGRPPCPPPLAQPCSSRSHPAAQPPLSLTSAWWAQELPAAVCSRSK